MNAAPAHVAEPLPQAVRESDSEEQFERDRPEREPERTVRRRARHDERGDGDMRVPVEQQSAHVDRDEYAAEDRDEAVDIGHGEGRPPREAGAAREQHS
jgi:hypothetical protein